eukprot:5366255-Lingulodinium_polyedra.AAC.1
MGAVARPSLLTSACYLPAQAQVLAMVRSCASGRTIRPLHCIALRKGDGTASLERYTAPAVPNSVIPALLGLRSRVDKRALLDVGNKKPYICGP